MEQVRSQDVRRRWLREAGAMNTYNHDRRAGLPLCSWWTNAEREAFTVKCEAEAKRMARSKLARSLGLGMVIAQIGSKGQRQ